MKFFRKTRSWVIIWACTLLLSGAGFFFMSFDDNRDFETMKHLDIYYNLMKKLNELYVDKLDASTMVQTSIDEMLKTLDPYTVYIPESKMEDFKFMTTGQYGGVGAAIRSVNKQIMVSEVYENFPAHKAGLKSGEILLDIDGKPLEGKTTEQVSELLKGQPGTSFSLKVKEPLTGQIVEKKITREQIKIESVPYYTMLDDKTGYLILTSFTENASDDVKNALTALKNKGAESIVFDLRDNPGGLLIEAVKICNLFVDKGKEIVDTKGKYRKTENIYSTMEEPVSPNIPIIFVVSSGSASASEIVSGAMQDLDRAVIVGQRTFGKGLVQTTCDLSYNTKLKVTTAKYYIPSGRCIQALDYSHRNPDGSVGKVPDSLITEFKTKGGRSVYDGGGVMPDVEVKEEEYGIIVSALSEKNIIFDFATTFQATHKTIDSAKTFTVTDGIYNDFIAFATGKNFEFQTESEKILKNFEKEVETEKYLPSVKSSIEEMKRKIAEEKKSDFMKYKQQISHILGAEIVSRYYYQKGRIIYDLRFSDEIKTAKNILTDRQKYDAILAGKEGTHLKK